MKLALITSSNQPVPPGGEAQAINNLKNEVDIEIPTWDQSPARKLKSFDKILVRTCWDYHTRYDDFTKWLQSLQEENLNVVNPVNLLLWNSRKTYMLDLQASGAPVIPTYKHKGLEKILDDFPTQQSFIIKAVVSASAYQMQLVDRDDIKELIADEDHRDIIVQPYIEQITRVGEWSLVFFGTTFSHSVLKRPQTGDYCVQAEYGGSVESRQPPEQLLLEAYKVVRSARLKGARYGRIDMLLIDDRCYLMEVELIEPELFIDTPAAVANYRDFILGLASA